MSTHNIGFYEDLTKIIFQLSSNMHLISSSDTKLSFAVLPWSGFVNIERFKDSKIQNLICIQSKTYRIITDT